MLLSLLSHRRRVDRGSRFPGDSDAYIPRVYFLDRSGEFVKVDAPNPSYKYFFSGARDVLRGMRAVLDGATGGSGAGAERNEEL